MENSGIRTTIHILVICGILMIVALMATTAGCITAAKNTAAQLTATPEPTPTPYIPIETPKPTPTPTPEPTLSEAQFLSKFNGMKEKQWLTFERTNVSGYKDVTAHITIWGHRELSMVEWYSVSWGQYFMASPGEGKKFLFIYAASYTDDNSSRMWGIQPQYFTLDVNGTVYKMTGELLPSIRIHDLDEVWDYRHVETIQPYGYDRMYNSEKLPVAYEKQWLRCGVSNMWSGYIPFIVPKETNIKDVRVLVNTHDLIDYHWWQLE